ncbi:hypothetical protein L1S34_08930 [Flavobacterium sp. K77]|uniref:hypothetical protein n=1 Tax=Flavobacterium sp. K77 TaxID=2910676 RepID=UPI001F171EEB|nr:hypothetical protein [Flavobacterium sp. K77]MCF6141408.1 hypothetical protein [Flavobacterium sp. K77]
MKHFLIFIIKIVLVTFLLLVILDVAYTKVYLQSTNRGKIGHVVNSKDKQYDVVVLGSSRANNHFVTPMFEAKGLKAFNYGMSGGHLFEASLMLKLMMEQNYKIKNIILEADLNLSNEKESETVAARFMPYLHESTVIANHFEEQQGFNANYYLPFYRYIIADSQIGFREMYQTALQKPTNALNNLGYYPLGKKPNANMKNNITNLKPLRNKYYEEIKHLCKVNNINLIVLMTPMCENTKGLNYFDKVKKLYPEIYNYENAVIEDRYFSSCGHLNDAGARKFTQVIIQDFFTK